MVIEEDPTPIVTFIVPAYNAIDAIGRALASLTAQTRGNWEAVVVDDGSTDGTGAEADRIAALDRRVRVVHQANSGVSSARNAAIREARGDYLAFLDADDAVDSCFVEKLASLVDEKGPDVFALAYRAEPRGNTFSYGGYDGLAGEFLIRALASKYATFPCWMFAISRQLVVDCGLMFTEGRRTGEDQEFILKALCVAEGCRSVEPDDVFYVYQTSSETSAMGRNLEGQFDYPKAMKSVLGYFEEHEGNMDADTARHVEGLLADRFVGGCGYAAEMALGNGAADADVIAWIGDAMAGSDWIVDRAHGYLRRENRAFLRLWQRNRRLVLGYVRARAAAYRLGRSVKAFMRGGR